MVRGRRHSSSILIAGYYGFDNVGDEVILQGVLHDLRALQPDVRFVVVSGNPQTAQALHGVDAITWGDQEALFQAVDQCALVIVGGGGLFQDYWGVEPDSFLTSRQAGITAYGAPLLLAKLLGKPAMIYAAGVGPLSSAEAKRLTRELFEMADRATVRDLNSLSLLREIGCQADKIQLAADPAFSAPGVELGEALETSLRSLPRPILGVSLRHWEIGVRPDEWQARVAEGLNALADELHGSLMFVPFQQGPIELENDVQVCERVRGMFRHERHALLAPDELDPLQRFALIGRCDLVLGMRLHSIVAAVRNARPCVGLSYDPKVRALLEQVGLREFCLPLQGLAPSALAERLLTAHRAAQRQQAAMTERTKNMEQLARSSAEIAVQLLHRRERADAPSALEKELIQHQIRNLAKSEQALLDARAALQRAEASAEDIRTTYQRQTDLLQQNAAALEQALEAQRRRADRTERQATEARRAAELEARRAQEARASLGRLQSEMTQIRSSRGWKVLWLAWRLMWSARDRLPFLARALAFPGWFLRRVFQQPMVWLGRAWRKRDRLLPPSWRVVLASAQSTRYTEEDNSQVVLYTDNARLFPSYPLRRPLRGGDAPSPGVTLVATVKNEAQNARGWLADLEEQTRLPDEVILLDGGSTDGTPEILQAHARASKLKMRVLIEKGANIARRRNLGVRLATHPTIAMTDFGCDLTPTWLESLLAPFRADPQTDVVAGWYESKRPAHLASAAWQELIPNLSQIEPDHFLPACRSIAFSKRAWESVGGFPEWLTKTGEDTYFGLELKRVCTRWAFVPEAIVIWHAPRSLSGVWSKLVSWTVGDGESGVFLGRYLPMLRDLFRYGIAASFTLAGVPIAFWLNPSVGALLLMLLILLSIAAMAGYAGPERGLAGGWWKLLGRAARAVGFLRGVHNRPQVAARRHADAHGVVLLLTGVPIDDTGGGARGTQIALELLRRGCMVLFVHRFPKQESVDLRLKYRHPHLLHHSLAEFHWESFLWEYNQLLREKPVTCLVEFPFPEYLTYAREIARRGGAVVYDLIDDWGTSLGGDWYSPKTEAQIVATSRLLVGSAPSLVERLGRLDSRGALFLPNAVNLRLFDRKASHTQPDDLPNGGPILIYVGALWGEWFDWELLRQVSERYTQCEVVVIGDYRGQCPFRSDNLHFLGLKPQAALPGYLARSDVALIPWSAGPITESTSPLKVYEYVAMGLPVVAPWLPSLDGVPHVLRSRDREHFLANIQRALEAPVVEDELDVFLAANSWSARIDRLGGEIARAVVGAPDLAAIGWLDA